ncbi:hypothetical protein BJ508DRAFT_324106 [Ascobolus immersus RN42]|uniref:Uncharacterized protein n=1 Tax=Ascobolus immersus RN42 TaxID=1160509 RepID=A0A3N4ICD4_ASCIM|nr:hypothetical protein BJ508DRAFT_324106 [Ascobolus immersus RN42]
MPSDTPSPMDTTDSPSSMRMDTGHDGTPSPSKQLTPVRTIPIPSPAPSSGPMSGISPEGARLKASEIARRREASNRRRRDRNNESPTPQSASQQLAAAADTSDSTNPAWNASVPVPITAEAPPILNLPPSPQSQAAPPILNLPPSPQSQVAPPQATTTTQTLPQENNADTEGEADLTICQGGSVFHEWTIAGLYQRQIIDGQLGVFCNICDDIEIHKLEEVDQNKVVILECSNAPCVRRICEICNDNLDSSDSE